jgi:hypothetical protein
MPDYVSQIKKLVARYEAEARKQVKTLQGRAKQEVPRRRQQLLAAVRRLRKLVNQQLGALERKLQAAGGKAKRR